MMRRMNLSAYLDGLERGQRKELADALGVSSAYLYQMATARRPVPPDLAPAIEQHTSNLVRRWDLRPDDWHRIWPELIGSDGAPTTEPEAAHG